MSETYRYTGKHYSNFTSWDSSNDGQQFSAANAIVVTISTPTALPPNLALGDVPPGTLVSIGDGGRSYDNIAPGQGEYITLSAQLSTGGTGEITAWSIDLSDNGLEIDGPPITNSYELSTSGGLPPPASPQDSSTFSLNPTALWFEGSTDVSGDWSRQ
jgi:hypothetical protein